MTFAAVSALAWGLLPLVVLSAAWWGFGLWGAVRLVRGVPRLRVPAPDPGRAWPRVSTIVPARDEAATIEAAVRSRLADDYPDLQLVLVDDRSADGTGALIDALAAGDPRVRAVHVTALPPGWLGKVHALEQGRAIADGAWLCFSDADVHLRPGALRAAVAHAEARGLDFLTVIPVLWPSGFVVDAVLSTFTRALAVGARLWAVRNPASSAFAGIGAFNLVRRDALARTPGFEWLRLEVVDDGGLGLMCKRAGLTCDVAAAPDLMGLHFYRSLGEMARGVEKNGFAAAGRFSWPRMLALATLWPLLDCGVLAAAAPGLPAWLRATGAAGLLAAVAATLVVARWGRRPLRSAFAIPLGTLVLVALLLRSAWRATRQGGIAWRGTLYPLADLRAGQRIFARSTAPFSVER